MNETDPSPWEVDFGLTPGAVRHLDDVAWAAMDGREEAEAVAERRGLEHFADGTYRTVFVPTGTDWSTGEFTDVVFKFGVGKGGWHNNGNAIDTWLAAPHNVRSCLLPILAHHTRGGWIAQPKATETHKEANLRGVRECIRETMYRCRDLNIGNTGKWRGEHVMVDYGAGCYESGLGERYERTEWFGDRE